MQNYRKAEGLGAKDQRAFTPNAASLGDIDMDERHVPPDRAQDNARHGAEQIKRRPEDMPGSPRIESHIVRYPAVGARSLHQIIGHTGHASARLSGRSHEEAATAAFGTE